MNKLLKSKRKGFSLVELIVVIAIMAVLVAVLAPSLLAYVERSRAQKDDSAMGEVTNSVLLALSDSDVYDELLEYSIKDNVSCYIDKTTEVDVSTYREKTKDGTTSTSEQYIFGDEARIADETQYFAAGNMRGVTITFEPSTSTKASSYTLSDGIINKFASTNNTTTLIECPALYNAVRATVGDQIGQTSQTYRNSEYTIFIKISTIGGNDLSSSDTVQIYGQYSGTNLSTNTSNEYLIAGNRQTAEGTSSSKPIAPGWESISVDKLQELYQFEYYSSLELVVQDVNNEAIGDNANSSKDDAYFGVYVQDGDVEIVLLKDYDTNKGITFTKDVTLTLNGHALNRTYASGGAYYFITTENANLTIDGVAKGSAISTINETSAPGFGLIGTTNGSLKISGGTYTSCSKDKASYAIVSENGDDVELVNCTINSTGLTNAKACSIESANNVLIKNCTMTSTRNKKTLDENDEITSRGLQIVECDNVDIYGTTVNLFSSNYKSSVASNSAIALSLLGNDINVDNCKINSTANAVFIKTVNDDKAVIKNSTLKAGEYVIRFFNDKEVEHNIFIENTDILQSASYQDGYTIDVDDKFKNPIIADGKANIYLHNCTIEAENQDRFMWTLNHTNIYMSMCTTPTSVKLNVGETSALYLGVNNTITKENVTNAWPGPIVDTNQIYSQSRIG